MSSTQKITPDDIKAKLTEIQGDATNTVDDAKSKIIAVVAVGGVVIVVAIFLLGRRGGRKKSTIIELRRN